MDGGGHTIHSENTTLIDSTIDAHFEGGSQKQGLRTQGVRGSAKMPAKQVPQLAKEATDLQKVGARATKKIAGKESSNIVKYIPSSRNSLDSSRSSMNTCTPRRHISFTHSPTALRYDPERAEGNTSGGDSNKVT